VSLGFRAITLTGNLSIQVICYLEHVSIYTLYLDHVRQDIAAGGGKEVPIRVQPFTVLGERKRGSGPQDRHPLVWRWIL
jgi:hypothetical protein